MSAPAWRESRVRLTCRLGELRLFALRFRVLECSTHFSDLGSDPDAFVSAAGPLPEGCAGRLVRSHPVRERLPRRARAAGSLRYVPHQYERFVTDLRGSFADYLAKFSSKSRANLRKKLRRFEERCGAPARWRVYRTPDELSEFHAMARAVSARTYQERLLDSGLPDDPNFLAGMRARAAADSVRAFLLFHGDRPVAYLYCPSVDGILIYDFLGYDPEYRDLSPGTVLHLLALEALFAEGRWRMFDYTEGEGEHKKLFATGSVLCADVYYLRPTLRNRAAVALHRAFDSFSSGLARLLDRIGLKKRLKRLLRAWSSRRSKQAPPEPGAGDAAGTPP